ncbi:VIT1/CCC1 transporter family protein [Phytohabitans rumicis]|uniref:Membrane protein n=1 Tax=Phytohabitans rumicis TaxID=1076125 RepID=A0A6V8LQ84_9ACTN|nr:VIT1/CCC1 transporter family protein [Phytohabitans rumicis]GFJ94845.1 membrane protein [Phytohabitans rumicis]
MTSSAYPMELHRHHRDVTGGWLRPAVFGVMDGLVSNAALIAGVVGGGGRGSVVVLAGLSGLAAGACSMAVGEYTSVASQSDLVRAELDIERRELARDPDAEQEELTLLYQARGLDRDLAELVAQQLHRDPETAWRVHAREELGVDPDDLPSPWLAAVSSFTAFALGALVPLLPFLLGLDSVGGAVALTLLALFATGAAVARLTGRALWRGGGRQLLLGVLAAAVTFTIGSLAG